MLISLILIILLTGSVLTFLTKKREACRIIALISTFLAFIISIYMFITLKNAAFSHEEQIKWIESVGISYHMGVDGISMPMVLLTTFISFLCVIYAWDEKLRPNQFFGLIVLLDFALVGVFASLDFFLFYIFWELVLIPMFFVIGIWGGPRKNYSAIKFLIYTHVSSVVMLAGIFGIFHLNGVSTGNYTFDIPILMKNYGLLEIPSIWRDFIFAALLFGFLVKMPAVPFHTWLPDAHVEAPTVGSILLAGVLLKMGGYGLIRFLVPMSSNASSLFIWIIAAFGVASILYTPLAALPQRDLKRLIAFSSIGHMGFISLGVAASLADGSRITQILALTGATFLLFAHGIITSILFGSAGIIQHHTGTRLFENLGGLMKRMPKFSLLMVFGFFASLGFPGMIGFVAEFSILAGSFPQLPLFTIGALLSIPLSVIYHLFALQRTVFGTLKTGLENLQDLKWYEFIPMLIWVISIIIFGIFPSPIFDVMRFSVEKILGGAI
jgi:NADH-quinone oxidoreductase subunit M